MKRRHAIFFLAALLVACGRDDASLGISDEPAVAISQIDGPLVGSRAGALVDAVDARTPRSGALLVAAAQLYDPVTGQTTDNPISVYVTASDELGLDAVELLLNGTTMGAYLESSDVQVFGNPFIFPAPRSDYLSVPIPGSPSGLVASQLRARATDTAGLLGEEAVLEVQADGSRPDLSLSALGDGPPFVGPVTLNAQAADPETGIRSFAAFLNGEIIEINPATPNAFSLTQDLEPGVQTVRLVATNGVLVPNEAVFTFTVVEEPEEAPTDPENPTDPGEGNQQPVVSLLAAPTEGEPPLTVSFTASASDPDGDEVTYLYDFGDGVTTAGAPAASHTYTEAGTYTATVTVADGKGGTASSSATITVGDGGDGGGDDDGGGDGDDGGDGDGSDNQAPEVSLTAEPDEGSAPLTVDFTAVASDPDGDELSYVWNFGDGERASGEAARTHTYSAPGSYTAFVVVRDGSGGKARAEVVVEVGGDGDDGDGDGDSGENNQPPVVTLIAIPTEGDAPLEVTFSAEASDPDGDPLEYVWNFGDNENATGGTTQTHTYEAAATYVASVTVTDGQGGKAIVEVTIAVN
jgi:PKD repeat protein